MVTAIGTKFTPAEDRWEENRQPLILFNWAVWEKMRDEDPGLLCNCAYTLLDRVGEPVRRSHVSGIGEFSPRDIHVPIGGWPWA